MVIHTLFNRQKFLKSRLTALLFGVGCLTTVVTADQQTCPEKTEAKQLIGLEATPSPAGGTFTLESASGEKRSGTMHITDLRIVEKRDVSEEEYQAAKELALIVTKHGGTIGVRYEDMTAGLLRKGNIQSPHSDRYTINFISLSLSAQNKCPESCQSRFDAERFWSLVKSQPDMTGLTLTSVAVSDNEMSLIRNLPQLINLSLIQAEIQGQELSHLKQLKRLRTLALNGNEVQDYDLKALTETELFHLFLGTTPISDNGLTHLASLKQLKTLDLRNTNVTSNGISKLKKALPECKILSDEEIVAVR